MQIEFQFAYKLYPVMAALKEYFGLSWAEKFKTEIQTAVIYEISNVLQENVSKITQNSLYTIQISNGVQNKDNKYFALPLVEDERDKLS